MTITDEEVETPAGVAGGFELAPPETRAKEKTKKKTRNEESIRCTATGKLHQYR
jgi:hypothetical protein